jgi:endogenous inhibitor of DNA gyrase (YacG/DUF329 family)
MTEPNLSTVFVAENLKLAEAVIQLLAANDIPAEAIVSPTQLEAEPITGMTDALAAQEFAIRVTDATKIVAARDLLSSAESAAAVQAIREKRLQRTGMVTAICEECGKASEWPAETMGTTDTCPFCSAYMDIPDPDDDWSDVDVGQPDEDEEASDN